MRLTLEYACILDGFDLETILGIVVTLTLTRQPALVVAVEAQVATLRHPVPFHCTLDLAVPWVINSLH
jgi:hypothetical protein